MLKIIFKLHKQNFELKSLKFPNQTDAKNQDNDLFSLKKLIFRNILSHLNFLIKSPIINHHIEFYNSTKILLQDRSLIE